MSKHQRGDAGRSRAAPGSGHYEAEARRRQLPSRTEGHVVGKRKSSSPEAAIVDETADHDGVVGPALVCTLIRAISIIFLSFADLTPCSGVTPRSVAAASPSCLPI